MNFKEAMLKADLSLGEEKIAELRRKTDELISKLKTAAKASKINFETFVGGSFGKKTLEKSDFYDVDIFVRFDKKEKHLSEKLERALKKTGEKFERVHGSRDYFRIKDRNVDYEFVPVLRINKPKDAENVTDLSYFHVNFVRKNMNEKIRGEILAAKKFCKAAGVYGAESYVNGFSGYALECLIIYFGSFEKMLKALTKLNSEKLVIDIKKFYKKKEDVVVEINEAKTKSPIVLVDPTWKERNVLAALNDETFRVFQTRARQFLRNPSEKYFVSKKKNFDDFSAGKSGESVRVILETDRQEGDIAGTKMKKFSYWLVDRIGEYFLVSDKHFVYESGKCAELFITAQAKKEVLRQGPFVDDKKNAFVFRKINKKTFEKNKRLFVKIEVGSLKDFLNSFLTKNLEIAKEMGIVSCRVAEK